MQFIGGTTAGITKTQMIIHCRAKMSRMVQHGIADGEKIYTYARISVVTKIMLLFPK